MLFVLARITSSALSTGEPLTITEIADDNECENSPDLVVENDEGEDDYMSVVENDDGEDDYMSVVEDAEVEPAIEKQLNSREPNGGPEPAEAACGKCLKRNRLSAAWKRLKRVFRYMCCCGCRRGSSDH